MNRVTEREITLALKERHQRRGDYFATQVKMGAAGSKILDAIAIPVTWSPRTIIGYEIKTSRADFLSDQKYPHYMTTCNLFYFVVPKGLITKDEVPSRVGILEYNNGNLRQFKRAVYENVDINVDMLLHCIFYKLDQYNKPKTRQEYIDVIKSKVESNELGDIIGKKYRELKRKGDHAETKEHRYWVWLNEHIEEEYGIKMSYWDIKDSFDPDNKKYNEAVEILEKAAKLFKKTEEATK